MSILDTDKQFHLNIKQGDVGKYVILPGDPGRVPVIAEQLDSAEKIAENREYNIYTGFLSGEKVSVVSTGIGGPSAAIAVEELVKCGADTFIRVGTSGGMDSAVCAGDLVIAQSSVRSEGTSHEYLPDNYPASADFSVLSAIVKAAESLSSDKDGMRYHVGTVHCKDSFYGETNPETMPVGEKLKTAWDSYIKCGCLASEMETAAVYAAATVRGARAGAVLTAIWNVQNPESGKHMSSERAITCAVRAIKILIENDNRK